MTKFDVEYYRQRAETEALRALEARDAAAAEAHNRLAAAYAELIDDPEAQAARLSF